MEELQQRRRELEEVDAAFGRMHTMLANIAVLLGAMHPLASAVYAMIVMVGRHKKKVAKELKALP